MANRKRGGLWVTALIIALISAALQIAILVGLWLQFDSRLSCDRMIYWNEWLDCMHGQSHLHILFAELSIATWTVAGIVGALGRFLPPYISFIFLSIVTIAVALLLIGYWYEWSRARSDTLYFTLNAGLFVLISLGPSVSAWLLGLHKRTGRRAQLQLSTVFE